MTSHSTSLKRWAMALSLTLSTLVGGMAYLLWQDAQQMSSDQEIAAEVSSIRIQREAFDDIVIVKNDGQWMMESPCPLLVNEQRLMPLLNVLQPGALQYQAGEVDLFTAGLETPSAIVYLDDLEHRIGNTDLSGDRRYLQRGSTVELIPEWVLSLVNGGVTALARLELFTDTLGSLAIVDDQGIVEERSTAEELGPWQNLAAQQISTWPVEDAPAEPSYSLTATNVQGNSQTLAVFEAERFIAIRFEDAKCAYILGPDELPE